MPINVSVICCVDINVSLGIFYVQGLCWYNCFSKKQKCISIIWDKKKGGGGKRGGGGGSGKKDGGASGGGSSGGGGDSGGGCKWLWLLFIVVDILFYCDVYIILLC